MAKKKHHEEEHEEHVNHEAWVIPYADVLTLLMALFLVMWATGSPDAEKTTIAAESFRNELRGGGFGLGPGDSGPFTGGNSIFEGVGPVPERTNLRSPENESNEGSPHGATPDGMGPQDPEMTGKWDEEGNVIVEGEFEVIPEDGQAIGDPLTQVEVVVRSKAEGTGLANNVGFRREGRGLVVSIVTDRVVFADGSADIQPEGFAILDVVADALNKVSNLIVIEGHTDSRPLKTRAYATNWELSSARATAVLRYLTESQGVPRERISSAAFADTKPVAPMDTAEGRSKNRRVEIIVHTSKAKGG